MEPCPHAGWSPPACQHVYQGVLAEACWLCCRCSGTGAASPRQHGQTQVNEEIRSVP